MNEFFKNIPQQEKMIPSSAGSQADLRADVNIAKVYGGYFSSLEVAKAFVDAGIQNIEKELPKYVRYADFGGGQGFLTKVVAEHLASQGHTVDAFVLDSNEKFLDIAQQEGLSVQRCNLESCTFQNADLITMRAVNHYNGIEKQIEILQGARNSLKNGGFLISQISSGSELNCRLRSDIVNLHSLERSTEGGNYHWTSVEEYSRILRESGFENNEVIGYAPDCKWSPEEQWDRFHTKELKEATDACDISRIEKIEMLKKRFLKEAYALIGKYADKHDSRQDLGVVFDNDGRAIIHYQYPIIKSQKEQ